MQHSEITELFRYYGNLEWALDVLTTKRVYCPKVAFFNDPFDGSIPFEVDFDPSEFIAYIYRTYKDDGYTWSAIKGFFDDYIGPDGKILEAKRKEIEKKAKKFKHHNDNLGVLCLTEDPISVLMWSHYADKHKGVCIGFSRVEKSQLADDDACNPIIYSDVYPSPRFSQIYRGDGSLTKDVLYSKARDWSYEKEWRMMSDKGDFHASIPGPISRVILGCRFPFEQVSQFAGACKKINVQLLRAHKIPNHFALELKSE